jgi:hypothetical protein
MLKTVAAGGTSPNPALRVVSTVSNIVTGS